MESQNLFKQVEWERMVFNGICEGDVYPSPEEAWRWKSLGIKPDWMKDTNTETWLGCQDVKVASLEDLKNIEKQLLNEIDEKEY